MLRKGTSASPAIALASSVFPVPGWPTRRSPLGILPPSRVNFLGSLRNSITSSSSALASSIPATSAKVTFFDLSVTRRALLLPNAIALPPPACIWRMKNIHTPMSRSMGTHEIRTFIYQGDSSAGFDAIRTPLSFRICISPTSFGAYVLKVLPLFSLPEILSPCMVTSTICPFSA